MDEVTTLPLFAIVMFLSLLFTYSNGFQDGSSVASSAIGSRSLTPLHAVLLVSVFELLGALFGGSAVANTIHTITDWPHRLDLLPMTASALSGAIGWNYLTRKLGYPSSSTHALVGGLLGAIVAADGAQYIRWGTFGNFIQPTGVCKILISLIASPLVGFTAGYFILAATVTLLIRASSKINIYLKRAQWLTLALMAFGHGANDTQKAIGVMLLASQATGMMSTAASIPLWMKVLTGFAMSLGVLSLTPKIVRRVGSGIYKLRPVHGFATGVATAGVLMVASLTGGPVSATQVIASSVMGVGSAERRKGVHWQVARDICIAWFLTIPCAGLLAWFLHLGLFQWLMHRHY